MTIWLISLNKWQLVLTNVLFLKVYYPSFDQHIKCNYIFSRLYFTTWCNIANIRSSSSMADAEILNHAFVSSRLVCCEDAFRFCHEKSSSGSECCSWSLTSSENIWSYFTNPNGTFLTSYSSQIRLKDAADDSHNCKRDCHSYSSSLIKSYIYKSSLRISSAS